jgi:DNA-binding transcriptional ArsR family regulator
MICVVRTTEVISALSALAHEHRLAVYRLLVEQGHAGLSAGVIAERIGLVPSSLTFHVQALQRAGLISARRASRQVFYAVDFAAMNALVGYLTENCCGQGSACTPSCKPASSLRRSRGKVRRAA